ncbi:esterase E4-like [Contarinia nasturtii]|uniref:esterase E4-like n=1 Tax=Contarinia nasturtii TaxID=265458 RepID=UPI0012D3D19B|nr:esterase E4-like [Contarinia nasturtii]
MLKAIFLLCSTGLVVVNCENVYKIVKTKSGPIRGLVQKTLWYEEEYYSFRGIPYAKPPVGGLRFKAPEPFEVWTDPFDAFRYGRMCSQIQRDSLTTSENCLFLNIFTPDTTGRGKLPVIFVIHGGLYAAGSGDDSRWGPDFFIENDVIVVTINYRLGAMGFMSLGSSDYSGNMGMKDQQLALKWIHDNIDAFGGDNNRITICGISAGSKSIGFHLFNKESSKNFNQILGISGVANAAQAYQKGDHKCLMRIFFQKHNSRCPHSDDELIEFLQNVDVDKIIKFTEETIHCQASPWNPIVEKSDAKSPFLLEDPEQLLKHAQSINKTAYFTFARYEQLYFTGGTNYTDPKDIEELLRDFFITLPIFGYSSIIAKKPYLRDLMDEVRSFYFGKATTEDEVFKQRLIMDSDIHYVYFIEKWLEQHVAVSHQKTFYQRFSAYTKINERNFRHGKYHIGSHADENCYAFRCRAITNLYKEIMEKKDIDVQSAIAFRILHNMQKLFSNFVTYGNPIHNGNPTKNFLPLMLNKASMFNFVDVTNDGLSAGIAPNANRSKFIDYVVNEVKRLVEIHGDTPSKTPIQQMCDEMLESTSTETCSLS